MSALAVHRPKTPEPIEPLVTTDDLREILRVERRTIERMRASGRLPKPDMYIGRLPRWRASTIREWIERGV